MGSLGSVCGEMIRAYGSYCCWMAVALISPLMQQNARSMCGVYRVVGGCYWLQPCSNVFWAETAPAEKCIEGVFFPSREFAD